MKYPTAAEVEGQGPSAGLIGTIQLLGQSLLFDPRNRALVRYIEESPSGSMAFRDALVLMTARLELLILGEALGALPQGTAIGAPARGEEGKPSWSGVLQVMRTFGSPGEASTTPLGSIELWPHWASDPLANSQLSKETFERVVGQLKAEVEATLGEHPLSPELRASCARGYDALKSTGLVVDMEGKRIRFDVGGSGARKTSGAYYTPRSVVRHVLSRTLGRTLNEIAQDDDAEERIIGLKVVDPACGAGAFLIEAGLAMARALVTERSTNGRGSDEAVQEAFARVAGDCLYGVDLDPVAVQLCRIAIWMAALAPGVELPRLDRQIVVGNALIGATPRLVEAGIPDAAFGVHDGDDPSVVRALAAANSAERSGQTSLLDGFLAEPDPVDPSFSSDAWSAAFLQEKSGPIAALVTSSAIRGTSNSAVADAVGDLVTDYLPLHWAARFPEVFSLERGPVNESMGWAGGFDVVIGNPPFLNQLETDTASSPRVSALLGERFGQAAHRYTDAAALFFVLSSELLALRGGRLGLVMPDSFLSTGDARFARARALDDASLESVWLAGEKVFDANVHTCVITARRGRAGANGIQRYVGPDFRELPETQVTTEFVLAQPTWAFLVASAYGIPELDLGSMRSLGQSCSATADFRDQYYGIAPFVRDGEIAPGETVPLVTSGLIDPARNLWGTRGIRFNKRVFERPVVDIVALRKAGELKSWSERRLVPKVLVATQTRVLEAVVDEDGSWLPSVPVLTVTSSEIGLFHVAAVIMSPPATAWAARNFIGAALGKDAIKLSAAQVMEIPAPEPSVEWDAAADLLRQCQRARSGSTWRSGLLEAGKLMCKAYGVDSPSELLEWWEARLPDWKHSSA